MIPLAITKQTSGILTYGITPPKKDLPEEKILEICRAQMERIHALPVDALILYDIQDEKDRVDAERPFPYLETIDPLVYSQKYLCDLELPKIVYRCVGKYSKAELYASFVPQSGKKQMQVFVGAASSKSSGLSLSEAYTVAAGYLDHLVLGGVMIPERHAKKGDEHLRVIAKTKNGCRFFVSQAIYNIETAKDFLSDYALCCRVTGETPVPIIFTLTPCGSEKTLTFMKWLGIAIPHWLENDLVSSPDILETSLDLSESIFTELWSYAKQKGIPIGCNVESVSTRKIEIEASVELVSRISRIMGR